jgi:hypothetical protein
MSARPELPAEAADPSAAGSPAEERCPECGLAKGEGRYGWGGGAAGAHAERCTTCGRVHDAFPAGALLLAGPGYESRRREVLERVGTWAKLLAKDHPARRITAIEPLHTGALVKINDARLAMRVGDALMRSFGGALECRYVHGANLLRVAWNLR